MGTLIMDKQASAATPAAGDVRFYVNSSGIWCSIDENGIVKEYGSGGEEFGDLDGGTASSSFELTTINGGGA